METRLIPDEQPVIEQTLIELCDTVGCHLVLTTGGTGPAPRDVTPEATLAVAHKVMPGFGEQMRQISLAFVPTAILSRQVGVIRGRSLILNLPGQPKAIKETLEGAKDAAGNSLVPGIFAAVPYCIDLIGGPYIETNEAVIKAFRPKSAIRPKASGIGLDEEIGDDEVRSGGQHFARMQAGILVVDLEHQRNLVFQGVGRQRHARVFADLGHVQQQGLGVESAGIGEHRARCLGDGLDADRILVGPGAHIAPHHAQQPVVAAFGLHRHHHADADPVAAGLHGMGPHAAQADVVDDPGFDALTVRGTSRQALVHRVHAG
jgi:molybdopterin adenylyltransferase